MSELPSPNEGLVLPVMTFFLQAMPFSPTKEVGTWPSARDPLSPPCWDNIRTLTVFSCDGAPNRTLGGSFYIFVPTPLYKGSRKLRRLRRLKKF